jgi:prolyl 4-hydroxylase
MKRNISSHPGIFVYVLYVVSLLTLALAVFCFRSKPVELFGSHPDGLKYSIYSMDNVLTSDECARLIVAATPKLFRSHISDKENIITDARTSMQAWIPKDDADVGDVVWKLISLASRLTGVSDTHLFEDLQVARYMPSQQYKEHYDACVGKEYCLNRKKLYRRATLMVYLTDDFSGGETYFPRIGTKVKPVKGRGILFYNTDADTGLELPDSLHAGLAVTSGIKWICNIWVSYDPSKRRCDKELMD